MPKKAQYTIQNFEEDKSSNSNIINLLDTSKKLSWKTQSSHAVLEIVFPETPLFEIKLSTHYSGILTPLLLKIQTIDGTSYEKQHILKSKYKHIRIPIKKLKSAHDSVINYLKFEFTKIDEHIEVQSLSLILPKEALLTPKKKESKYKLKAFKQTLREKAAKSFSMEKNQKKKFQSQLKSFDDAEERLIKKQERLKKVDYEEGGERERRYKTRSAKGIQKGNSYSGLLQDKVVGVDVRDDVLRKVVIEMLEVMGAICVEKNSQSCNFVVCEQVMGLKSVQEVSVKWLFECAAQRELFSFGLFK